MTFDRKQMWWKSTWAYRLFHYHHIQLNNIYWSNAPVATAALKRAKVEPPNTDTAGFFTFSGDDARRIPHPLSVWAESFKESQTWMRSSLALVIASIIEVYLKTVVTIAVESDPGLLLGASSVVDGVKRLKSNSQYSYAKYGEECAKGQWPKRINAYRSLFGSVPKELENAVKELEQLRVFRNGAGHTFGRGANEYQSRLDVSPKPLAGLSEERLKKWLALSEKIVKAIDQDIGPKHIGEYETIYFYHSKIRNLPIKGHTTPANNLMKALKLLHGHGPGKNFCKELVKYYNNL